MALDLKPTETIADIGGPPATMKLPEEQITGEFRDAGFKLARSLDVLRYQYLLIFEKQ
jgi:hypothetical protein